MKIKTKKNKKRKTIAGKTIKHRIGPDKLAKAVEALSHGQLIGPKQLAHEVGCNPARARIILGVLSRLGCKMQTAELREGLRGPAVTGHALIENRASKKILKQSFA